MDLTIVFPPATEAFVQVESCFTVSKLHIREPLSNNIEECRIQSNGSAYNKSGRPFENSVRSHTNQSYDYPALPGIVRLPEFISPAYTATPLEEACIFSSLSLSP
jgi:hypothetical protein